MIDVITENCIFCKKPIQIFCTENGLLAEENATLIADRVVHEKCINDSYNNYLKEKEE